MNTGRAFNLSEIQANNLLAADAEGVRPASAHQQVCGAKEPIVGQVCTVARGHEGDHAAHDVTLAVLKRWPLTEIEQIDRVLEEAGVPLTDADVKDLGTAREKEARWLTRAERIRMLKDGEADAIDRLIGLEQRFCLLWDLVQVFAGFGENPSTIAPCVGVPGPLTEAFELAVRWKKNGFPKLDWSRGHVPANPEQPNTNYCKVCGGVEMETLTRPCRGHNR
jgi:hypothetical protein